MSVPNVLVPLALLGFVPAAVAAVLWLGARRGLVAAMLGGWLFLPSFDGRYSFSIFHGKAVLIGAVLLVGSLALDLPSWRRLRPGLLDVPMAALCLLPFATSLANGLGAYDGAQAAFEASMTWGAPYLIGRLYFRDARALRHLASALVVSGLVYVPFSLWEIRMSPQLHKAVYGFTPIFFAQAMRYGGYRPNVFMRDGLMLAMFLAAASVAAYWSWRTGALRRIARLPAGVAFWVLALTTLLTKSVGAIVLLVTAVAALEGTRKTRSAVPILLLLIVPPAYCASRILGWSGAAIVDASREVVAEDRAQSLEFRMVNENMLIAKALRRPWLGWGRWGRARVYDADGRDISITDGLWIIVLGNGGFSTLVSLALVLGLPAVLLLRLFPPRHWTDPRLAAPVALTTALLLWQVDEVLNGMIVPVYPAMAGAMISFGYGILARRRVVSVATSVPEPPGPGELVRG